jgi:hypothetical protein
MIMARAVLTVVFEVRVFALKQTKLVVFLCRQIAIDRVSGVERERTKRITYGIIYGIGKKQLGTLMFLWDGLIIFFGGSFLSR